MGDINDLRIATSQHQAAELSATTLDLPGLPSTSQDLPGLPASNLDVWQEDSLEESQPKVTATARRRKPSAPAVGLAPDETTVNAWITSRKVQRIRDIVATLA